MSKQKYKSKSQDEWLLNSRYKDWIRKVENDVHSAHCSYCMTEISIAGQGVKASDGHVILQKHFKKVPTPLPLTAPAIVKDVDSSTCSTESKVLKQQSMNRHERFKAGDPKIGNNVVY